MGRAAADDRGMALLTIHQRNHPDHTLQLHGEGYRIGRDAGMEIRIEQASVSRLHALLQKNGRHWILRDQGSTALLQKRMQTAHGRLLDADLHSCITSYPIPLAVQLNGVISVIALMNRQQGDPPIVSCCSAHVCFRRRRWRSRGRPD